MPRYTAITIGPIVDTLSLTDSPAGTWGASYLFSWLARELIAGLLREGIPAEQFAAPYFEWTDGGQVVISGCEDVMGMGVGMFHDHIIFQNRINKESEFSSVHHAIQDVTQSLAKKLKRGLAQGLVYSQLEEAELAEWLGRYLRIYAVERGVPAEEGPITAFGPILDGLELEPSYIWEEQENPLVTLFESQTTGASTFGNRLLAGSFLTQELSAQWMLRRPDGNGIRDIVSIAGDMTPGRWKSRNYYCVLCSDGDSMGKMYRQLTKTSTVQEASRRCIAFCAESARCIRAYDGMPIYAGGDDLLAILPVTGKDGQSVLGLVQELNDIFNKQFETERTQFDGFPSLSVGISIQYVKSPLYEAMQQARNLLYEAKKGTSKKNGLRIQLIKHSGQKVVLSVDRVSGDPFLGQLEEMIQTVRYGQAEEFLASAGYQLELYHGLFLRVLKRYQNWLEAPGAKADPITVFFKNLFDDEGQKQFQPYLTKLSGLCQNIVKGRPDLQPEDLAERQAGTIRFLHFMAEEGTV